MSGGVDSTVCAHLIKERGYDAEGITMRLWSSDEALSDGNSPAPDRNCLDAGRVAEQLGIPFRTVSLGDTFRSCVVDRFVSDYTNGMTPNPCVECNRHIKFGKLIEIADSIGAQYLATGHYARIEKDPSGNCFLKKAKDISKDQSYFLWPIKKEYLPRLIFPLGEYTKSEVREIAEGCGYESAHRSDSQDICFIPDGDYVSFIEAQANTAFPSGDFISPDGKILGRHEGIIRYTVGQRKGLGIALGEPAFVARKDVLNNTVTLCSDKELYQTTLTASDLNLLVDGALDKPCRYEAKIRYRHSPSAAYVERIGGSRIRVTFDEPQRAIAAGQSVVLYDGDILIGGAIIDP